MTASTSPMDAAAAPAAHDLRRATDVAQLPAGAHVTSGDPAPGLRRTASSIDPAVLGVAGCAPGTVHLVGAGPGDPGLLTLAAAALLSTADVVVYDRLAPAAVLALAPARAERICVGKQPGRHVWTQRQIDRLLVDEARRGRAVVRLKGGDPFVFGRGGEEVLACAAAGVPCQVVSGVTSAVAAPAAGGIPVTHRGVAAGVAFVTGHEDPTKPSAQADLAAVARFPGTLVFLMGVGNVRRISEALVAAGRPPTEAAAIVRCGTTPDQHTLTAELGTIADEVIRAGIRPPATIVVGDVVGLAPAIAAATAAAATAR